MRRGPGTVVADWPPRVEPGQKRVRALVDGAVVLDTARPALVWEGRPYPAYHVPREDVRATLTDTGETAEDALGTARLLDVALPGPGGRVLPRAARTHPEVEPLQGLVRLDWTAADTWLEEDEPVTVHPRDPYVRVDALRSSRHVRVVVDGVVVAESSQPTVMYETGHPPRFYLPYAHVRHDLVRPSATTTECPYKGAAAYLSFDVGGTRHEDLAWTYPSPLPESQKIAGLVCFPHDRAEVVVDGVPVGEARPAAGRYPAARS